MSQLLILAAEKENPLVTPIPELVSLLESSL